MNTKVDAMAMSFDVLRVGHTYRIKNYGDVREFKVMRKISDSNYLIKDVVTLESFELEDLVRYGKGKDYDLDEIDQNGEVI